jgi:5'(3')-deoxyribonucleotidase
MAEIVYIDMDDTLCDFTGAFQRQVELNPEVRFPQSQYGFFAKLKPLRGALETIKALYESEAYDPYILTAPSTRNPLSYTEKRVWIEEYLGYEFCERLILCPHKGLLKGDFLIDDHVDGKGQDHFEGELLHFGSPTYPDWTAIRAQLGL